MGRLGRATMLPRVPPHALRNITGGVTNEQLNQAAPGEYQPISELITSKYNRPWGTRGNSTGLLNSSIPTRALRMITGKRERRGYKASSPGGKTTNQRVFHACNRRYRCRGHINRATERCFNSRLEKNNPRRTRWHRGNTIQSTPKTYPTGATNIWANSMRLLPRVPPHALRDW